MHLAGQVYAIGAYMGLSFANSPRARGMVRISGVGPTPFSGLGKLPDTVRTGAQTKVSKTLGTVETIVVIALAGAESANTF
jgi:hypothetical protein